jgi:hypothetical protein
MHAKKRYLAAAAGVAASLAIAAPVADASAATAPDFSLPALDGLPAMDFIAPSVSGYAYARGTAAVNDVFNGPTVVQIINGPADSSIIG